MRAWQNVKLTKDNIKFYQSRSYIKLYVGETIQVIFRD